MTEPLSSQRAMPGPPEPDPAELTERRARYFVSNVYLDDDCHAVDHGITVLSPSEIAAKLAAEYVGRRQAERAFTITVSMGSEVE